MTRILLALAVLLYSSSLFAQRVMSLQSDTIRISSATDSGELVIRNHSRGVPGVLYNKGNGVTEFRTLKFIRVGDSTLAILGQDTTSIVGGSGVAGNVYYGDPDVLLSVMAMDPTHMQLRWWKTSDDLYQSARIGVIGDSQGKGEFTSSYQYSIIGRLQNFIYAVANNDAVTNYCQTGYNSRQLSPTGSNPYVDTLRNITKALRDGNKIIILCNTSNDFSPAAAGGITTIAESMANTLKIAEACEKAGATLFVISSFPRNDLAAAEWDTLRVMAGLLNQKFGSRCAYVYHLLEDPAHPNQLNPDLEKVPIDNIHLNDAGANIVYTVVRDMLTSYFTANTSVLKYQLQRSPSFNGNYSDYQYVTTPNIPSLITAPDSNFYRVRLVYNNGYYSKWSNFVQGPLARQDIVYDKPPIVTVSNPQIIYLPNNTVSLTATATDVNTGGSIVSYNWTRILGGAATITAPNATVTTVSGLQEGRYVFRCQVTNAIGLSSFADAMIDVRVPDSNTFAAKFNFNLAPQNIDGWLDVSGGPLNSSNTNKVWSYNNPNINLVDLSTSVAQWGDHFGNDGNDNGTFTPDAGGYPIPAAVIQSSWYTSSIYYVDSSSNQFKLTGLSPAKKYKLKFYCSLKSSFGLDADPTVLVVNDNLLNQKQVNAVGNSSNVVMFRGIVPNTAGEIRFFVGALQGQSFFGMLNGLVVQEDTLIGSVLPPVVLSGGNRTITLPNDGTSILATATDANAALTSVTWTKVSGPSAGTITSPSSLRTTLTGLTAGTYIFRCTVTNNYGASGYADVQVVVNPVSTDPMLYVGVSYENYSAAGWTVLNGTPHASVLSQTATLAGSTVNISTVNTGNWVPFSTYYSAGTSGETNDDGGGFLAPQRVQQGNFFTENAYDPAKPQLQVTNLPAGTYTVTMFGSLSASFAASNSIESNTEYRVNGSQPVTINTTGNTSHAAVFTNITVSAGGTINLFFNPLTPNSNAHLGLLSYFVIDKTN
ncbi:MAG: hypothetical protein J0H74_28235 [Chitinophagaceae bacterium]|nr:hypothetical protein [Chitinophagaceae bacterium]